MVRHSGGMLCYFAGVSMSVDSAVKMQVGDELAFRHSFGTGWSIYKVEKITPSGRIVCGRYTLNPDLRIRGERGYHGPYCGEIVTPKIRAEVLRQKQIDLIADTNWKELSDAVLEKVVAAIQSK